MTQKTDNRAAKDHGLSQVEELTDEGLAAYLFDALVVFRQLADAKNMDFLTYLLDMAAQEAHVLSGQERARMRVPK